MSNKLPSSLIKKLEKAHFPSSQTGSLANYFNLLQLDSQPIKVLSFGTLNEENSSLLNSTLHPDSLLVFNEIHKNKVGARIESQINQGYPHTIITQNESKDFNRISNYFDLVIFNEVNFYLEKPEEIQVIINSLKGGGHILFSGRTPFSKIDDVLLAENQLKVISTNDLDDNDLTFLYHKGGDVLNWHPRRVKIEKSIASDPYLAKWIIEPEKYFQFLKDHEIVLFPKKWHDDFQMLHAFLSIKRAGFVLGKLDKKGELIPNHELACSRIQNPNIQKITLNDSEASSYLRREPVLNINTKLQGWALACLNNRPLGWLKLLAEGRSNNYYPKPPKSTRN